MCLVHSDLRLSSEFDYVLDEVDPLLCSCGLKIVSIITDLRVDDRLLRHLESPACKALDPFEPRPPPGVTGLPAREDPPGAPGRRSGSDPVAPAQYACAANPVFSALPSGFSEFRVLWCHRKQPPLACSCPTDTPVAEKFACSSDPFTIETPICIYLFTGSEAGSGNRIYVQEVVGGDPRPISPEGYRTLSRSIAMDDRSLIVAAPDGALMRMRVAGGLTTLVPGTQPGDVLLGWASDGKRIFVYHGAELLPRIFTVDLTNGERRLW